MAWECGIGGCGSVFDDVESAVVHQVTDHEHHECKVCASVVPDGYPAIRHVFTEHSRAEYVRSYGASSADVRQREEVLDRITEVVDAERIETQLQG